MAGQISASNQLRSSSELAPNMFGASSEQAKVMEFGFNLATLSAARMKLAFTMSWRFILSDFYRATQLC